MLHVILFLEKILPQICQYCALYKFIYFLTAVQVHAENQIQIDIHVRATNHKIIHSQSTHKFINRPYTHTVLKTNLKANAPDYQYGPGVSKQHILCHSECPY